MTNLAIIPARGGSQRIPRKNIRMFAGKPIIAYSIETARASKLFDEIIVSTEDEYIVAVAKAYRAKVHMRPARLCADNVGTQEVMKCALNWWNVVRPSKPVDLACCIYATAPLMKPEDLQAAVRGFSIESRSEHPYVHPTGPYGADAGQWYLGRSEAFLKGVPLERNSWFFMLPEERVCDINTEEDWQRAEKLYGRSVLVYDEIGDVTEEQWQYLKGWRRGMNQQETEWAGRFGDEYARRSPGVVENNRVFFIRAIGTRITQNQIGSVIEFGAGVGSNLIALRGLLPSAKIDAVEINPEAMSMLIASGAANGHYQSSALNWVNPGPGLYDLAFTKGFLIHVPAEGLADAYKALYQASRRFILLAEYFSPVRTEIEYRGRRDMLWKADFAGAMLYLYPDLHLASYGFVSKRDQHPQDDLNWWSLEKK